MTSALARLTDLDRRVLAESLRGLPLAEAPYAALGAALGVGEADVLDSLQRLEAIGVVKRFGLVVRHRELGFRANAMCVFDVPDERVGAAAARLATMAFVTLCYRRVRRPPVWPFNLFCMIHGTDQVTVREQYAEARRAAGLDDVPSEILFSTRAFKQCAGRYVQGGERAEGSTRAVFDGKRAEGSTRAVFDGERAEGSTRAVFDGERAEEPTRAA